MRQLIYIIAKRFSIAIIFTVLVIQIQAQSNHTGLPNMKLDQLSDQQIMQIWQKSKNSTIEHFIYSILFRTITICHFRCSPFPKGLLQNLE